jgi:hypothetical protein
MNWTEDRRYISLDLRPSRFASFSVGPNPIPRAERDNNPTADC